MQSDRLSFRLQPSVDLAGQCKSKALQKLLIFNDYEKIIGLPIYSLRYYKF